METIYGLNNVGSASPSKDLSSKTSPGFAPSGIPNRYQFILLHALIIFVLCYQLLSSRDALLSFGIQKLIVVGLIGTVVGLILLPAHLWAARWLAGALVIGDTVVTASIIYLSGQVSSTLYVTYFLIMLIAGFAPTLKQAIGLSALLCVAYGVVLSLELSQGGALSESRLLQIPILLILAIFYGVTNQAVRELSQGKRLFIEHMSQRQRASERQRAEEALRKSEERFRRLLEVSPDAIVIARRNRIVFTNSTGFQLFGATSREQIIGRSLFDFFHPEYDPAATGKIRKLLEQGQPVPLTQEKIIRLDGTVVDVEVLASLFAEQDSTAILMVLRNITERKQLAEQLHQSQKMDAVGQLARGIAHDFDNMLTIIAKHSDLLMERKSLSKDQLGSVEQIRRASKRAASLTNKLLALSRQQVLQPKLLDLNAVVVNMDAMIRSLLGERIELFTILNPALGHVKADPGQLEQVILNLVFNARDAMPQGGRLTIQTDNVVLEDEHIRQYIEARPGPHVMLSVHDTGIGMDAKTQARIFEPSFTTKARDKGTGLGLSTVYGIVKQSGGHICVQSEPYRGALFKIYLPRVEARIDTNGPDMGPTGAAQGSETVLIAEDEPGLLTLVCGTLQREGYKVLEARHGKEALLIGR
ncbi:MAG TPA: PAS domain S-box protein, partial [Nitrospiraceae bacterium]|nr:PAS domain S-box protein [Nitrospiraceae bacterium]